MTSGGNNFNDWTLKSKKLNPQYNKNTVLTMPWVAWGGSRDPRPGPPPLATGLYV